MSADDADDAISGGCHMCLAIPGKIVELFPEERNLALVDVAGVRRRVDLGLLEEDRPVKGDWVLIHVGFAMSKISEQDALNQMNTLAMLGEAEAALQEIRGYGLGQEDGDPPVS
ncbi:MAG: HypC/HybG/HupF family hydrogenase formation chaperone [Candidatus Acidiferrales bacterium]